MTQSIDRRVFLATTAGAALAGAAPALAQGGEDAKLRALLDKIFNEQIDDSPERATSLGLDKEGRAELKSRLDDNSQAARARRLEQTRERVAALRAIDRKALNDASKVDLDTILYVQQNALAAGDRYKFGSGGGRFSPYVISQQNGVYRSVPAFLDNQHRVRTAADADAYLARLRAFAVSMDQDLERMRADVAAGVVPPDFVCDMALG